jgi:hypothetical protein
VSEVSEAVPAVTVAPEMGVPRAALMTVPDSDPSGSSTSSSVTVAPFGIANVTLVDVKPHRRRLLVGRATWALTGGRRRKSLFSVAIRAQHATEVTCDGCWENFVPPSAENPGQPDSLARMMGFPLRKVTS